MSEPKPKTVVIADDSRFFRSMLSYALSEDGVRPLVASSGPELLEILAREMPDVDLVLLDLVMPGMNGFEVLEKIRATRGCERLPVVVVTQFGLNPLERGILAGHGVSTVLSKAASVERILFEVRDTVHPEDKERRKSGRTPLSLAVTARTSKTTYHTTTFNLSEAGMFLVIADEGLPAAGSGVLLKFWVPDEETIFEMPARVAWVNSVGTSFKRTHPAGFGVEFESRAETAQAAIRRFLAASS